MPDLEMFNNKYYFIPAVGSLSTLMLSFEHNKEKISEGKMFVSSSYELNNTFYFLINKNNYLDYSEMNRR